MDLDDEFLFGTYFYFTQTGIEVSPLTTAILYTAGVIILFGGLVGNSFVLIVGLRHVKLSIAPYLYVLNLAFLNVIFVILLATTLRPLPESLGCSLHGFLMGVYDGASWLILLLLSVDRVWIHSQSSTATKWRGSSRTLIGSAWVVALLQATPHLIYNKQIGEPGQEECLSELGHSTKLLYHTLHFFVFPILIIILFAISIIKTCRSRTVGENRSGLNVGEPLFVNKCTLWILGIYLLVPFPKTFFHEITHVPVSNDIEYFILRSILPLLSESYILAPPILAFWLLEEFSMGLQKMCSCSRPKPNPQVSYTKHENEEDPGSENDVSEQVEGLQSSYV